VIRLGETECDNKGTSCGFVAVGCQDGTCQCGHGANHTSDDKLSCFRKNKIKKLNRCFMYAHTLNTPACTRALIHPRTHTSVSPEYTHGHSLGLLSRRNAMLRGLKACPLGLLKLKNSALSSVFNLFVGT